jgi:hypothetical protein
MLPPLPRREDDELAEDFDRFELLDVPLRERLDDVDDDAVDAVDADARPCARDDDARVPRPADFDFDRPPVPPPPLARVFAEPPRALLPRCCERVSPASRRCLFTIRAATSSSRPL